MTFFDDVFSQMLLFHSISNRVWWRPKIDRRLVFRKMHLFLALYRQYKRLAQDVQIRFLDPSPRALAIRNQRFRALLGGFFGVLSEGSRD